MRVVNCQQGSPEWLRARCGNITASRLFDVVSKRKHGEEELAKRRAYRLELIGERLSGSVTEHYVSEDMERGTEWEPMARTAYEMETGAEVDVVGFVLHPEMDFFGASPDGLIGADGGLELKVPKTTTHLTWLLAGVIPEKYLPQCLGGIICTGRQWWDFASYAPELPDGLSLFKVRMYRDEALVKTAEEEIRRFNGEIEEAVQLLSRKITHPKAAPVEPIPDVNDPEVFRNWLMEAVPGDMVP